MHKIYFDKIKKFKPLFMRSTFFENNLAVLSLYAIYLLTIMQTSPQVYAYYLNNRDDRIEFILQNVVKQFIIQEDR